MTTKRGLVTGFIQVARPRFLNEEHIYENIRGEEYYKDVSLGVIALDSVDVAFEPGEIHAIIGENGAGKSTLIKCLTGVYEPEEGEVMISGENAMKNKALFDKVAYVPQEIDLFGYMSVAENLFIPYEKSGIKGTVNQKELEKRANPILEKFSFQ